MQGTLSPDGSQINWSNGTYWARCDNGGVEAGAVDVIVRTFREPGIAAAITRWPVRHPARKDNLTFTNEQGQTAQGKFLGNRNVTANWGGTTINGDAGEQRRSDQLGQWHHVESLGVKWLDEAAPKTRAVSE